MIGSGQLSSISVEEMTAAFSSIGAALEIGNPQYHLTQSLIPAYDYTACYDRRQRPAYRL